MGLIAGLLSAGATLAGGFLGADAERDAADEATALQRESRDISLRLAEPGLVAGNQALQQLGSLFGISVPSLGSGGTGAFNGGGILGPRFDPNNLNEEQRKVLGKFMREVQPNVSPLERSSGVSPPPGGKFNRNQKQARDEFQATFGFDPFETGYLSADNPVGPSGPSADSGPAPLNLDDLVTNNPLIRFNREQGERAVARGAAARGLNQSGGTLRDLAEFNQDLSGAGVQQFVLNPLFQLAGFGQQSASMGSSAALNTGTNLSNIALRSGDARSSAFSNAGNSIGSAISDWGNARTLRDILAGGGV